ncbi:MAG: hypothetical protein AAF614_21545 [Chloroflexota bacterium]
MGTATEGTSPQLAFDFNRTAVWLGRLVQLIETADEWENIAREIETSVVSQVGFGSGEFGEGDEACFFEELQVQALAWMLVNLRDFAKFIVSRYMQRVSSSTRRLGDGEVVETHLLRAILSHLSTDLSLIQMAVSQRQRTVSSEDDNFTARFCRKLRKQIRKTNLKDIPQTDQYKTAMLLREHLTRLTRRTKQAELLIYADFLAKEALAPANKYVQYNVQDDPVHWGDEKVRIDVITYFAEDTRIRSLPYYPDVILLGIPFAVGHFQEWELGYYDNAFDQETDPALPLAESEALPFEATIPWELLMIPHEIGHYVYWNGRLLNEDDESSKSFERDIVDKLTKPKSEEGLGLDANSWQIHWLEELFCDVYSCLIMGPLAVLGLQAIIADSEPSSLFHNNGFHPISGLRPLIANRILERADATAFPNAIEQLKGQWKAYLSSVGQAHKLNETISIKHHAGKNNRGWLNHSYRDSTASDRQPFETEDYTFEELLGQLDPVIDTILGVLKLEKQGVSRIGHFPWAKDLAPDEDLHAYQPLLQQLTSWPVDRELTFDYAKRHLDFSQSPTLAELKELPDAKLVSHLMKTYLNVWGDKGPEMDFMGG